MIRPLARWLRYLPDRLLHARRRRAAEARLAASEIQRIVVVCHGNICRSPYAEAVLRRLLSSTRPDIAVSSAGFIGPDREPPANARAAATARGHDLTKHRSRLLEPEDLSAGTLVIVMNAEQLAAVRRQAPPDVGVAMLGDFDPGTASRRDITDPVERPRAVFDEVYDRIDRSIERLAAGLTSPSRLS
jgi:protein-tyrosine phosphatase